MTTKKKARGKPFGSGQQPPKSPGRPSTSPEEKKLTRLTRTRFNKIVRQYLHSTKEELQGLAKNKETPILDLMVISVMNKAIVSGDEKKMNWFLEQLFGKLQEKRKVELSGKVETDNPLDLKKLTDEELEKLYNMAQKCQKES